MKRCKITIESGKPIPKGHQTPESTSGWLRFILKGMKKGQSFVWPHESPTIYRSAKDVGVKIITRKINGKGFRVWRVR